MIYKKERIYIEPLNRNANLYIGLPDDYDKSTDRYPVLYMHDGHNVFIKEDSYAYKTWRLLEAYEKDCTLPKIIVVGLECADGLNRFDEYSAFTFDLKDFGIEADRLVGGKGKTYLDYLVNELKPKIDSEYRTISDKNHTGIMGSSMGGVISNFAAMKYNHVFTRIAALSGSYFVSLNEIKESIELANLENVNKYYMDTGTNEFALGTPRDYLNSNNEVYEALKQKLSNENLRYKVIEGGVHNEDDWAKRLPFIIKYLFS